MKKGTILSTLVIFLFTLSGCGTDSDLYNYDDIIDDLENTSQETTISEEDMIEEVIYPHDEVVEVDILINEDTYDTLIENASDEEYVECSITYNGYTLTNVAIRAKGNSSLKDIVEDGGDRFSWNVDLNYYEDQDLFGIDKILLNNIFKDPTMMAEYITYEALASLDTVSSRTTFVALSINGEYYGLYLSVEQVGNEFLDTNFGNSDGELYKPENGTGANLDYISDNTNYSALVDENSDNTTNEEIIELMKALETGENIEDIFDVNSYLKYLAVSTYTVNLDSYQGGMTHNYYLYNNEGIFEWIAWDLNMAFNGFPMVSITDEEAVGYLIDEPVIGSMNSYPLIEAILSNQEYLDTYHSYLEDLTTNYFNYDTFEARVTEIDELINNYVENDTNSFYSYSEYQSSVFSTSYSYSLLQFVEFRTENVILQLNGEIESTNNGQGNEGGSSGPGGPGGPRR